MIRTLESMLAKLKEYENTDLMPEEIKALQDENISIKNWNACEKELYETLLQESKDYIELKSDIEQGRLVRLPCKVGDIFYPKCDLPFEELYPLCVISITCGSHYYDNFITTKNDFDGTEHIYNFGHIGVDILTKAEAQKALEGEVTDGE